MGARVSWLILLQLSSVLVHGYDNVGFDGWYQPVPHRPVDIITDVINDLGVRILQQYTAHGNVAFSPTGVGFVLAALYEGSAGRGRQQIADALGLPRDRDITRIGFRDIHRRLRTYLNADGFLGGLTLNQENTKLRPEYEDILRFYGFDLSVPDEESNETTSAPETTTDTATEAKTIPGEATTTEQIIINSESTRPTLVEMLGMTFSSMDEQNRLTQSTPASAILMDAVKTTTSSPSSAINPLSRETTIAGTTMASATITQELSEIATTVPVQDSAMEVSGVQTETSGESISTQSGSSSTGTPITTQSISSSTYASINTESILSATSASVAAESISSTTDSSIIGESISTPITSESILTTTTSPVSIESISSATNIPVTTQSTLSTTTSPLSTESTLSTTTSPISTESTLSTTTSPISTESTLSTTIAPISTESTLSTTIAPISTESTLSTSIAPISTESTSSATTSPITESALSATASPITTVSIPSTTISPIQSEVDEEATSTESSQSAITAATISSISGQASSISLENVNPESTESGSSESTTTTEAISTMLSTQTSTTSPVNATEVSAGSTIPIKADTSAGSTFRPPVDENTVSTDSANNQSIPIEMGSSDLPVTSVATGETGSTEQQLTTVATTNRRKRNVRSPRGFFSSYPDEGIWMQDLGIWKPYSTTLNEASVRDSTEISFLVNGCDVSSVTASRYFAVLPFAYFPSLHAVALEFPLDDPRYNILLMMATDRRDTYKLARDLGGKSLRLLRKQLQATWVRATIPSFMLRGFVTLTSFLQRLGILDVFEPRAADLSLMTPDLAVYARDVQQSIGVNIRSYMKPDRTHSRNGLFERAGPVPFTVVHPFLYFIVDAETSVALIAGRVNDPLNSRIL